MVRFARWVALGLASCGWLAAGSVLPKYTIQTVAGSNFVGDGLVASEASLRQPEGLAVDGQGNVYVADAADHRIRKISADGRISTVAGDGTAGFSGDGGPATQARLNQPYGLAIDSRGSLYIADLGNARIRRIGPDGRILTIAGGGSISIASGEGSAATLIRLSAPRNVAVDRSGQVFFSDFEEHRVYRIDTTGTLTTTAGTGERGFSGDGGGAAEAKLDHPAGLAVNSLGTLFVADSGNRRIRKVVNGSISTLNSYVLETPPTGLAVDAGGKLYAGGRTGAQVMGVAESGEMFRLPFAARELFVSLAGLLMTDGAQVRLWNGASMITIAGDGGYYTRGDGGPATDARLHGPYALSAGPTSGYLIADMLNGRIRAVDANGSINTTATGFSEPAGLAVDPSGLAVVADRAANRLARILSDGAISTIAGPDAALDSPHAVVFDGAGNLYVADTGNHSIRRVSPEGLITTFVEDIGEPRGLAFDSSGRLFVSDTAGGRILQLDPTGATTPVASGLRQPRGISFDTEDRLWVAESGANQVAVIGRDGETARVAGTGERGYSGDGGEALASMLDSPMDVLALPDGSVLVADFGNDRIRRLVPAGSPGESTLLPLAVVNAASARRGPVAPGEIVSAYGDGLSTGCSAALDGLPAKVLYSGAGQVNLVLPQEMTAGQRSMLRVDCPQSAGGISAVSVVEASPALFTNGSQAAAINQDGSANSVASPAPRDSIVSVFGTGLGAAAEVSVTVGGYNCEILYAGPAPGFAGLFQINVRMPSGLVPPGDLPIVVSAAGVDSPSGVTLRVR